jgi:hypothetical protein
MQKRPLSVTILCWFLLISNSLALLEIVYLKITNIVMFEESIKKLSSLPFQVQLGLTVVSLVANAIFALAMLKRKNWGRIFYVIFNICMVCISLITTTNKAMLLPGIIFLIVITFFLFRPKANLYFNEK